MSRPQIDFYDEKWHWPAYKFGLDMAIVTGSLFDQYNTQATPLQGFDAFFCDVKEISRKASSRDEFYNLLKERHEQRKTELEEAFRYVSSHLVADPDLLPKGSWGNAVWLFNSRTKDAMVKFFGGFLVENKKNVISPPPEEPSKKTAKPSKNTARSRAKAEGKMPVKLLAHKRIKQGRVQKPSIGRTRYNLRTPK